VQKQLDNKNRANNLCNVVLIFASISTTSSQLPCPTTPPDFSFTTASESEILKSLSNCPNKQSDSNSISTWLTKERASLLVSTIINTVNLSLSSCEFHPILTESVISPLLKKSIRYGDRAGNTIEQNSTYSSVFSLIQMG